MLSYQDVLSVRLTPLTTAAAAWEEMADGFGKLGGFYEETVQPLAKDGGWVGASATYAKAHCSTTRDQYRAARIEARAIGGILRDIHGQFVERISALRDLVESAKEADMYVDQYGRAHYDAERAKSSKNGVISDGALQMIQELSWTTAIAAAVRAVDDADQGAKLALRDAAGIKPFTERVIDQVTGQAHTFNANAISDIEVIEAREAQKYVDEVLDGKKPSNLDEWERLQRDNADDEVFSRMMLNHLGPENTIKLTNQLNTLAYHTDHENKSQYIGVQQGFANSLATATQDTKSQFYKDWHAGMQKAGMKQYEWQGEEIRGYQSLVTLMQHGDGYSDQLMHDLGDDLIAAEKSDKDIWDTSLAFTWGRDEFFANDPLDGLLGVMSKDPAASAAFLDPQSDISPESGGSGSGNDRMKYLLRDRDWSVINGERLMPNPHDPSGERLPANMDIEDIQSRKGLGEALVSGTTGIDPNNSGSGYVTHSEANDRVFKGALENLSAEGDIFHSKLRTPMAIAMGNYGDEVHETTSAHNDGENPPLDRNQVLEVSKQISRDRFSYLTLQDSINREIVHDINTGHQDPEETWRRAGRTVGFLEEARYQGLQVDTDDAKSKATWEAKMDYHTWGGVVNFIPEFGDAAQRGVDVVTSKWLEEETRRIDSGNVRESKETNEVEELRLRQLAITWSQANPYSGESIYVITDKMDDAASQGSAAARGLAGKGS
ncbi:MULTISPECIES: hypothetical protein [Streptomyces]|uniref:hypothetical protein n=1 Tax=Streptomyces TaxID=1883 RepID=UPI0004C4D57A|nr:MULTISPECIES: hypothetical protein [unclassified Streptomyces]